MEGSAAERILLVLHQNQNQNQAVWAVKFYPVRRGTKAFRERCVS